MSGNLTIVIKHPVSITNAFLFGQDPGFSNVGTFLNASLIRRVEATLLAYNVQKFEDSLWHGEIHSFGMYDLLKDFSVHSAWESGFQVLDSKPGSTKKLMIHLGIRWEIGTEFKEARIYGPKSDPANVTVIDLLDGGIGGLY